MADNLPSIPVADFVPDAIPVDQFQGDDVQETQRLHEDAIKQSIAHQDQLQAQFGGIGNTVKAGALAAARGATLGTSDILANATGLTTPEELKGLAEANPLSSGAGQLAGGAALIGATGGAGALTEGLGAAAKIAGMAGEGAAFGAGNAVSDYAMGDPNLNAQKIAAHIGTGALLGGTLGALGESVKFALPKATKALGESLSKLKSGLLEAPEDGAAPSLIEKIAPDYVQKWRDGVNMAGKDPNVQVRELGKNLQNAWDASKDVSKAMYDTSSKHISEALEDMPLPKAKTFGQDTLNKVKDLVYGMSINHEEPLSPLSSPTSVKAVNSALDSVENALVKADNAADVHKALSDFATDIDKKKIIKFDTLPTASNMADQEVLQNIRNSIRTDLKNPEIWGDAASHYSEVTDNYANTAKARAAFQSKFMVKDKLTGKYSISLPKVGTLFNNLGEQLPSTTELMPTEPRYIMNNFIDQNTNMAKASENYEGFVKGKQDLGSYIESIAKKNDELAEIARAMGNSGAKTGLDGHMIAMAGNMASGMGVPRAATGVAMAATKAIGSITNPYQMGANVANIVSKLRAIGEVIEKTTKSIDSGTKSIFNGNTARNIIPSAVGVIDKSFNKNVNRVNELYNNTNSMIDHLSDSTAALSEAAPNITTSIHNTAINSVKFLNSKIPRPGNELPLDSKWSPTPGQKSRFNQYYMAVNDPINALNQVKNGSLSNETMEALQTVHPDLLADMQKKVLENMDPKKIKTLNYATKISLSKFLGQPLQSSLLPQVLASNQAAFTLPQQNQQSTQPHKRGSTSGLKNLNLANRSATQTRETKE